MPTQKQPCRSLVASVLFAVVLFLFILSFSIALPIYFRPFYYMHIDPLEIELKSGFSHEEVVEAYNGTLDYLTLPNQEFDTGVLKYSDIGKAHFDDCKVLFNINGGILVGSALCLAVLMILKKRKKLGEFRIGRFSARFYSGIAAILVPLVIGVLASINFDKAFKVFHHVLFPNKDNWILDWRTDELILILPEEFFRNCAILIGASILIFSGTLIAVEIIRKSKRRNNDYSQTRLMKGEL